LFDHWNLIIGKTSNPFMKEVKKMTTATSIIGRIRNNEGVIASAESIHDIYDACEAEGLEVVSILNPLRVGILDQYIVGLVTQPDIAAHRKTLGL